MEGLNLILIKPYYIITLRKIIKLKNVRKNCNFKNDRKAVSEAIKQNHLLDLNTKFTGINSTFESIDIVQIISSVEDQLEENGFEGCDLSKEHLKQMN